MALATAKTCRKRFFTAGGGQYPTADGGFIAAEMCFCEATVKKREEKEKKTWIEGNARHNAALIVLNCLENHINGNVNVLLSKELETLLK